MAPGSRTLLFTIIAALTLSACGGSTDPLAPDAASTMTTTTTTTTTTVAALALAADEREPVVPRPHEQFANRLIGETIVMSIEGSEAFNGTILVAEDGQVVRQAHDPSGNAAMDVRAYTTWDIGNEGFRQVQNRLREMGFVGDATAQAPFSGLVAINGTSSQIRFALSDSVSTELENWLADYIDLWSGLADATWPVSAEPTVWTPYRIIARDMGAEDPPKDAPMWPLDRVLADTPTHRVLDRDYFCFEGIDATRLWHTLMADTDDWQLVLADSSSSGRELVLMPTDVGSVSWLGALPDSCSGDNPRAALFDDPTRLLSAVRLSLAEVGAASRRNELDLSITTCPEVGLGDLTANSQFDGDDAWIVCDSERDSPYGRGASGFAVAVDDTLVLEITSQTEVPIVGPEPVTLAGYEGTTLGYCLEDPFAEEGGYGNHCSAIWSSSDLVVEVWGQADAEAQRDVLESNIEAILGFVASIRSEN